MCMHMTRVGVESEPVLMTVGEDKRLVVVGYPVSSLDWLLFVFVLQGSRVDFFIQVKLWLTEGSAVGKSSLLIQRSCSWLWCYSLHVYSIVLNPVILSNGKLKSMRCFLLAVLNCLSWYSSLAAIVHVAKCKDRHWTRFESSIVITQSEIWSYHCAGMLNRWQLNCSKVSRQVSL